MTGRDQIQWVLFLAQLPAAPSSARVALWRKLRSAGALGLLNGAWAMPSNDESSALFQSLATTVRGQGGHAMVFSGQPEGESDGAIVERFRTDRAREYAEFDDRSTAFLEEIAKETRREKFSFAELEEIEDDFIKLTAWLAKIVARDFFAGDERLRAEATLARCDAARNTFAETVYAREGVHPDEDDDQQGSDKA
jgi:hypothetical protein